MSDVTVVLTHWKREAGMRRVIDALSKQSVKPQLWLWNNSGQHLACDQIAWQVVSSLNQRCWPRWFLASQVETPYVVIHDDDLMPKDEHVLRDALAALARCPEATIVGHLGRIFNRGQPYNQSQLVRERATDTKVDMVAGRFMVLRTADLHRVPLCPSTDWQQRSTHEDLMICGMLAHGKPMRHLVPGILTNRFEELDDAYALSHQPDFYPVREQVRRAFLPMTV